jgi:hypothetical protein
MFVRSVERRRAGRNAMSLILCEGLKLRRYSCIFCWRYV